jgi:hypothetical protein
MKLLGPDWVENDRQGLIKVTEERAAIKLLKSLGGVSVISTWYIYKND